jgi:hypothetical protein
MCSRPPAVVATARHHPIAAAIASPPQTPSQRPQRKQPTLRIELVLRSPPELRTVGGGDFSWEWLCGVAVELKALSR